MMERDMTIKIRVWHKQLEEYVQASKYLVIDRDGQISSDNLIVEQFTGVHDMDGREIFEGDIVCAKTNEVTKENIYNDPCFKEGKSKYVTGNKISQFWRIERVNHMTHTGFMCYGVDRRFRLRLTRSAKVNNDIKVAGNIHENPELLETQND